MYVLQLMDWYSASFSVLFIAVVECIVINHVYSKYNNYILTGITALLMLVWIENVAQQ